MSAFEVAVANGRVVDFAVMSGAVLPCIVVAAFVLGYAWRRLCEHLVYED